MSRAFPSRPSLYLPVPPLIVATFWKKDISNIFHTNVNKNVACGACFQENNHHSFEKPDWT